MAEYDLPAVVDYVLKTTGSSTVGYVGFSQGTSSMFAFLSLQPTYAAKIKPIVAMAPVYTVANIQWHSLAHSFGISKVVNAFTDLLWFLGGEFAVSDAYFNYFTEQACKAFNGLVCESFLFIFR